MIRNIVSRVHEHGGKIVVNEVTTGIGRTGKWFGYNHYDIEPDMVAMGKGIGNGYPVSAAAINSKTIRQLEARPFKYAQSHQNDPLGAAVVKTVLQIIREEDLISLGHKKGMGFYSQLRSLINGETVLDVRGRGLMFAVDLVNEQVGNEIYDGLLDRGFIVCNRKGYFRIDPPLIIKEQEFSRFFDAFAAVVHSVDLAGT